MDMTDEETEIDIAKVGKIVNAIQPLLAGHEPHVQGAAIADILAIYIAAHAPHLRAKATGFLVKTATQLVPINEKMLFPNGVHPFTALYGDKEPEA